MYIVHNLGKLGAGGRIYCRIGFVRTSGLRGQSYTTLGNASTRQVSLLSLLLKLLFSFSAAFYLSLRLDFTTVLVCLLDASRYSSPALSTLIYIPFVLSAFIVASVTVYHCVCFRGGVSK